MRLFNGFFASCLRLRALIVKELLSMVTDKGSRLVLIVPVIVQSVLFGYGATFNLERVPWTVCDLSRSALSSEVIRGLDGTRLFELQSAEISLDGFNARLNRGEALVGVLFPPDFDRTGHAMLITDARNSTTAGIAAGYVSSVVAEVNRRHGLASPVTLVERYRWNENGLTRWGLMPALILALSMIQVLMLAGLSVAREREDGTFDMMLMTPAGSLEILIGKAVIPSVVACVQGFLIFAVGVFWFKLPFSGAWVSLGLLTGLFALSFVGLGLAISAWAKTVQQALVYVLLAIMPTFILSGLLTSVLGMPEWLQTLTVANPLRAAITALRRIYFEGAGFFEVLPGLWPVMLTGVVTLALAAKLFRSKIA